MGSAHERAAGNVCPPPPHALHRPYRRPLLSAAPGAAALAAARRAVAGALLAAATALTVWAAGGPAAIEGGHDGRKAQRCPEQETVHEKTPLSWVWKLDRSRHVTTRERGKAVAENAAADSIPPDATQDPHGADRYGERSRHVFTADAENLRHCPCRRQRDTLVMGVDRRRRDPLRQQRLGLPAIQLAAAGLGGRFGTTA